MQFLIGFFLATPWLARTATAQASGASAPDDAWRNAPPASTGIAVGQKIPAFSVPDQNGRARNFDSIKGPNGAAIYFMRSADW
jgi:hypothetical protein